MNSTFYPVSAVIDMETILFSTAGLPTAGLMTI